MSIFDTCPGCGSWVSWDPDMKVCRNCGYVPALIGPRTCANEQDDQKKFEDAMKTIENSELIPKKDLKELRGAIITLRRAIGGMGIAICQRYNELTNDEIEKDMARQLEKRLTDAMESTKNFDHNKCPKCKSRVCWDEDTQTCHAPECCKGKL